MKKSQKGSLKRQFVTQNVTCDDCDSLGFKVVFKFIS